MNNQGYKCATQICLRLKAKRYDLDDDSPHSIVCLRLSPCSTSIQIWATSGLEIRTQLKGEAVEVPDEELGGELGSACTLMLSFITNHIGLSPKHVAAIQTTICDIIKSDGWTHRSEKKCKRVADVYLKIITRYHHQDAGRIDPVNWLAIGCLERGRVEEEEEGEICSVCLRKLRVGWQVSRMPCKHMFHHQCLVHWLTIKNCCPLCRSEIPHARVPYRDYHPWTLEY